MYRNKVLAWATVAAMVAVVAVAAALFLPQVSFAQTDNDPAPQAEPARAVRPFTLGGDEDALAEALGITVEELADARAEAAIAALEQAVADDLLTQTQADTIRERLEASDGAMLRGRMGGLGPLGWMLEDVDFHADALLAEALDITEEELDAARSEAQAAVVADAVAASDLTQEEADLFIARAQLQPYLADARQSVIDAAIEAALADGAIDATQAEILAQQDVLPLGAMRGPRGGEGMRMRGFGGQGFGGQGFGGQGFGGQGFDGQGFDGMHFGERGQGMHWFGAANADTTEPANP